MNRMPLPGVQDRHGMKILHIISSLHRDGAQAMLYKLLSTTDRSPLDLAVVSLTSSGALGASIEKLGISVHALGMGAPLSTAQGLARLVSIARRLRPGVIQGWMYHANLAALLAQMSLSRHVPVVWNIRHTPHRLAYEKRMTAAMIRLGARLSARAARIVYVAEESAVQHEALGYRSGTGLVIPNGFDTRRFAPSEVTRRQIRAELGLAPSTLVVGLVARYHPFKDHATFLEAAAVLQQAHPDVHFLLAGRGLDHTNTRVLALSEALRLGDRLHLCGERSDAAELLPALDIATLTSYSGEGFPNVIGEAMACGVPCVVTDVGASARLVDRTGLVVPPRAPRALAEALRQLVVMAAEDRVALGRDARRRIQEHFNLADIVTRYDALYDDVLAGSTRRVA